METTAHQSPLQQLKQQLEQALSRPDSLVDALKIQCAVQQHTLMVLGQHPAYAVADPTQVMAQLQEAIDAVPADLIVASVQAVSPKTATNGVDTTIPIQLYLRADGQQHPYQTQRLLWRPDSTVSEGETEAFMADDDLPDIADLLPALPPEDPLYDDQTESAALNDLNDLDNLAGFEDLETRDGDTDHFGSAQANPSEESLEDWEEEALSLAIAPIEYPEPDDDFAIARARQPLPLGFIIGGAVVSIVAFTGALHVLSRPCVIDGCPRLAQANTLSQRAVDQLDQEASAQTIVESYDRLQEARGLLAPIPRWSPHYRTAQTQLETYVEQAELLEPILLAQKQALTAAQKSQNPPHPIKDWVSIQKFWQQAIARMETIAPDHPAYNYVQRKLAEYRNNLETINSRILAERNADQALNAALTAAQKAEALTNTADSFASWQFAFADWQRAVMQLRQIPQGTLAYDEAQRLLRVYQEKLANAQQRRTQEGVGADAYNKATRSAQRAQAAEQQNQWTLAVKAWQDAIAFIRQVPSDTEYAITAQSLLGSYHNNLEKAEVGLQAAVAQQQTAGDLKQTCAGTPTICTYTIAPNLIQVRLTPDYDRSVERAMVTATLQQDTNTQTQITQHVNTLLRALTTIGDNTGIPVELYDSQEVLLGRYVPTVGYSSR